MPPPAADVNRMPLEEANSDDEEPWDEEPELENEETMEEEVAVEAEIDCSFFTKEIVTFSVDDRESEGYFISYFPSNVRQSPNDPRGNNKTCSLIVVLVAHWFISTLPEVPLTSNLPSDWLSVMQCTIGVSDEIHNRCRSHLPNRYLGISEACLLIPACRDMKIEDEIRILMELRAAKHESLHWHLRRLIAQKKHIAAIFTYREKNTIFLFSNKESVLFFDSHDHAGHGAILLRSHAEHFDCFFSTLWQVLCSYERGFGYISVVA